MKEKRDDHEFEPLSEISPFVGNIDGSWSFLELLGLQELHHSPPPTTTKPSLWNDAEQEHDKGKKLPDGEKSEKTKGQKRPREQRFAFVTKSEVDHLEDGYRWRKYGQKAVKNSPFPRNYYRCTSATCGVKKRVERSSSDPTVVVTTYEGKHTHRTPPSPHHVRLPPPPAAEARGLGAAAPPAHVQYLSPGFPPPPILDFGHVSPPPTFCGAVTGGNRGLLQDVIPSLLTKDDDKGFSV